MGMGSHHMRNDEDQTRDPAMQASWNPSALGKRANRRKRAKPARHARKSRLTCWRLCRLFHGNLPWKELWHYLIPQPPTLCSIKEIRNWSCFSHAWRRHAQSALLFSLTRFWRAHTGALTPRARPPSHAWRPHAQSFSRAMDILNAAVEELDRARTLQERCRAVQSCAKALSRINYTGAIRIVGSQHTLQIVEHLMKVFAPATAVAAEASESTTITDDDCVFLAEIMSDVSSPNRLSVAGGFLYATGRSKIQVPADGDCGVVAPVAAHLISSGSSPRDAVRTALSKCQTYRSNVVAAINSPSFKELLTERSSQLIVNGIPNCPDTIQTRLDLLGKLARNGGGCWMNPMGMRGLASVLKQDIIVVSEADPCSMCIYPASLAPHKIGGSGPSEFWHESSYVTINKGRKTPSAFDRAFDPYALVIVHELSQDHYSATTRGRFRRETAMQRFSGDVETLVAKGEGGF